MSSQFDQQPSRSARRDHDSDARVGSNIDWCARCSKRLVGLNPSLGAGQALDLAHELSQDEKLRARSPETVAEELYGADLGADS